MIFRASAVNASCRARLREISQCCQQSSQLCLRQRLMRFPPTIRSLKLPQLSSSLPLQNSQACESAGKGSAAVVHGLLRRQHEKAIRDIFKERLRARRASSCGAAVGENSCSRCVVVYDSAAMASASSFGTRASPSTGVTFQPQPSLEASVSENRPPPRRCVDGGGPLQGATDLAPTAIVQAPSTCCVVLAGPSKRRRLTVMCESAPPVAGPASNAGTNSSPCTTICTCTGVAGGATSSGARECPQSEVERPASRRKTVSVSADAALQLHRQLSDRPATVVRAAETTASRCRRVSDPGRCRGWRVGSLRPLLCRALQPAVTNHHRRRGSLPLLHTRLTVSLCQPTTSAPLTQKIIRGHRRLSCPAN